MLAIGRLIEQKDHATLLEAFARVRARRIPTRGSRSSAGGRSRQQTQARVARARARRRRRSLPGRVEPRDWLERADVFAHTSRWEGFGIVLLEAMLAGLPVVATRVSAVPEIVVDGETGTARTGGRRRARSPTHLSALLADPSAARALGDAGLRRAHDEFSVARMAERTIDVYERGASREGDLAPRELARGAVRRRTAIALLSIWFHGHNNPRYAELLPRLERLDACLLRLPDARIPRGVGFRAFAGRRSRSCTARSSRRAARRYANLLTLDFDQLARWPRRRRDGRRRPVLHAARGRSC